MKLSRFILATVVLILAVPGCISSSNRHRHYVGHYVTGPRIHRSINRLSHGGDLIHQSRSFGLLYKVMSQGISAIIRILETQVCGGS